MINYTGLEYLKIDMANQFGLDKLSFEERIDWATVFDPSLEHKLFTAEDPFRYAAAVGAYRDAQQGIPTGHLPGLDVCASGIQILSILTGCKIGARNTGLIGSERADFYAVTTRIMNDLLGAENTYPRKTVKEAAMPFYYGSRMNPINTFGDNTRELKAFYTSQEKAAPGAYTVRQVLLDSWQAFTTEHSWRMPDGFTVHNKVTQMKDTKIEVDELDHAVFFYRHEVNEGTKEGLANAANLTHSVDGFINREMTARCTYNKAQLERAKQLIFTELNQRQQGKPVSTLYTPVIEDLATKHAFTSLAGIEYINYNSVVDFGTAYLTELVLLIEATLLYPSHELISIHDEFKAHANHMNHVRQTYIEICAEIAESNMLNTILEMVTGQSYAFTKLSTNLGTHIRNGNYALS